MMSKASSSFHNSLLESDLPVCFEVWPGPRLAPAFVLGVSRFFKIKTLYSTGFCGNSLLKELAELTSLNPLKLRGCEEITDQGVTHLKTLTNLTHLRLLDFYEATHEGTEHLKTLTKLTHLNLGSTDVWQYKGIMDQVI